MCSVSFGTLSSLSPTLLKSSTNFILTYFAKSILNYKEFHCCTYTKTNMNICYNYETHIKCNLKCPVTLWINLSTIQKNLYLYLALKDSGRLQNYKKYLRLKIPTRVFFLVQSCRCINKAPCHGFIFCALLMHLCDYRRKKFIHRMKLQ